MTKYIRPINIFFANIAEYTSIRTIRKRTNKKTTYFRPVYLKQLISGGKTGMNGTIYLPQTLFIFLNQFYLCKVMPQTFDISNLCLVMLSPSSCKKIEVINSEFEASYKIFTGTVNVMSCDHLIEELQIILKGVFAKNERGYRLNAIKKRF